MSMRQWYCAAMAATLSIGGPASVAQEATGPLSAVEGPDARIELGLHQRLITTRTKPGIVLAPFSTDGCSGGMSAGWALVTSTLPAIAQRHGDRPPWEKCCVAHDRNYHAGAASSISPESSFEMRRLADQELRLCVIAFGDARKDALAAEYRVSPDEVSRLYRIIAGAMYWAVRLGGAPCTGLSWRWGYGWPDCE
jgi:hypothetical protein